MMKPIYVAPFILLLVLLCGPSLGSISAATPTPVPTYVLPTERSYNAADLLGTIGPYAISHDHSALPIDMPEKLKGVTIDSTRSFWTVIDILKDAGALGSLIMLVLAFMVVGIMFRVINRLKDNSSTAKDSSHSKPRRERY